MQLCPQRPPHKVPPPPGGGGGGGNVPFSAQEWTTTTSIRPDGTTVKIARRADMARNSAGSTRHEIRTLTNSSPTGQPTGSVSVNIHDVPNHRTIVLHPSTNTAAVTTLKPSSKTQFLPVAVPFGASISAPAQDLGQRTIGGYIVTGYRLTLLLPAGTRSPTQEVSQTKDTWYSPDLQTVLLAETSDSLGNTASTVLTQIELGEPDASLFTIPATYATTTSTTPTSVKLIPGMSALTSIAAPQSTGTQMPSTTSAQQPRPIPLSHLYMHFFLYEAHLEHVADAHPEVPKGGAIKDHMRKKTGLSEAEWQTVSATSLRMETTLNTLNTQAKALIDSDTKTCQFSKLSCLSAPPNLPQLKQLQKQRDQIITTEIAALETALGPKDTARLHAYLQSDTASHVKVIPISPSAIKAAHQANQAVAQ